MAEETSGTPSEYASLVNSLAESAGNRIGLTGEKLARANDILNKINTANLGLQQFGFYKKLTSALKNAAQETTEELKAKLGASKPLGQEGRELTELAPAEEGLKSADLLKTEAGIQGRQILGDRPAAGEQVVSDTTENIPVSEGASTFESLTSDYVPLGQRAQFGGKVTRDFDPDRPLFEADPSLPEVNLASDAPLFLGQASGNVGVVARGGVPQLPQEQQPVQQAARVEGQVEAVSDAPVAQPTAAVAETLTSQEVAPLARQALAQTLSPAELSQSIQTGGIVSKVSGVVKQFQEFQGAFQEGISRVNTLKNQATQIGQQLKDAAEQKAAQGRQLISDGQDALARGEAGAQDLINKGQGVVKDALEQAANSDVLQSQVSSASDLYSQGQSLLSQGKSAGLQLIEQGNANIKTAQAAIQGYGDQAQALQQQLQAEVSTRVDQLQDLASKVASGAGEATQAGQQVVKAVASGDIQGAVEAGVNATNLVGKVAGEGTLVQKVTTGLAEGLPVAGEVVGAGLFIASLFSGLAEAFVPHESVPIRTTSFQSGL